MRTSLGPGLVVALLALPMARAQEVPLAPGADPAARIGGSLTQSLSEPSTLNYYATAEGATKQVMSYVLEPLFAVSDDSPAELQPVLARAWTVSEDGRRWVFDLRRDVQWSDGAPFTADDVVFTWKVLSYPQVNARFGVLAEDIRDVRRTDAHTVEVHLRGRHWRTPLAFGSSVVILPRHWYRERMEERAAERGLRRAPREPGDRGFVDMFWDVSLPSVGTGPYTVGQWIPEDRIILERNPTHWRHGLERGTWNIQRLVFLFLSHQGATYELARRERLDLVVVKPSDWADHLSRLPLAEAYEHHAYDHTGLGFNYVVWNCRRFPFDDARVRRAMTHLIDREGLLRDLWRGQGVVAVCPDKPDNPEYHPDLAPHPYDLERAARLLAEAGFTDHDGDGHVEKHVDGRWLPLAFALDVPAGIPEYRQVADRVSAAMARVGVRMSRRELPWSEFIERFYARDFSAMCLYSSFADPWIDHYEDLHSSLAPPRLGNASGLAHPDVDLLLEAIRREHDRERRVPLSHRLYEVLHEEQPYTLLIHGRVNVIVHKRVRNVTFSHRGLRLMYAWIEERR